MRLTTFLLPLIVLAIGQNPGYADAPSQIAATFPSQAITTSTTTKQQLILAEKGDRTERIRFQRGTTSATIQTSVVRGTRDTYLLAANRRQRMTVSITSLEKNAVFDIKDPNGRIIKQEVTNWSGVLPSSGDYRIIVGGTRGNANYRMRVSVR
ncbi:MAG: hypothetical protein ABI417_06265 [Coleofasciculaceae cyanobacterium]